MSDKAERLHTLIGTMQAVSQKVQVKLPGAGNSTQSAWNLPLWQAFGPVAAHMGYPDYGNFRGAFIDLCESVRGTVKTIPMRKESVRESWVGCLDAIVRVFDAENFGSTTGQVFSQHFSGRNLEILDAISERFKAADLKESSTSELDEALEAVRDLIGEFQKDDKLDARITAVLLHYLQQMEAVYSHVADFGEETFWKVYKEVFATFIQLHPIIAGLENGDQILGKLRVVTDKLTSKSVAGISLVANLATIGSVILPMLGSH